VESPRRFWWTCFACLALVTLAWALLLPIFAGPDESSHAMRATAVPRGQLIGERQGKGDQIIVGLRVPLGYADYVRLQCYMVSTKDTPACAPTMRNSSHLTKSFSDEYRAFPAYYAVLGVLSIPSPGPLGFYLMRALSALLCAAFLASAFVAARGFVHRSLGTAAVALAMTPQVLFLAGVINSNSLEIAVSICLWTAVLGLAVGSDDPSSRDVARAGVAAIVLTLTRGLSPGFVVVALVAAAVLASGERRRALMQRKDVRAWALGLLAVIPIAAGWIVYLQQRYPLHRTGEGLAHALRVTPEILRESVGEPYGPVGGFLPTTHVWLPPYVYLIWGLGTLGLVALALACSSWRARAVLLGVLAIAIVLPIASDAFSVPPIGLPWIGRYGLPLLVGIPIVAAAVADTGATGRWLSRAARAVVIVTFAAQIAVFFLTIRRFTVGTDGAWNPLTIVRHAEWTPPPGPAVAWFVVLSAALVVLAAVTLATADDRQT
jgi:hypothetical protein